MKKFWTLVVPLALLASGCATETLIKCPPTPWPNAPVIDYMQPGIETTPEIASWWTDFIRFLTECEALKNV